VTWYRGPIQLFFTTHIAAKHTLLLPLSFCFLSLRSKRFCGVREQRILQRQKLERVKEGGGSRPIFRVDKTPKIPFLGLSLLPNPTETLATQATAFLIPFLTKYFYFKLFMIPFD